VTNASTRPVRLEELTARATEAFEGVLERVFGDDPTVNSRLGVEAVEPQVVSGSTATLVLITPWMINGLLFPPAEGPADLVIAGSLRRAYRGDVSPLGAYWSVNLVPDVSRLSGPRQARTLASSFAGPFRQAVRDWLAGGGGRPGGDG
jgi:hypothetical protein